VKKEAIIVAVIVVILICLVYWYTSKNAATDASVANPTTTENRSILDKFLKGKTGEPKAPKNPAVNPGAAPGSLRFAPPAPPASGGISRGTVGRTDGTRSQQGQGMDSGPGNVDLTAPARGGENQPGKDQQDAEDAPGANDEAATDTGNPSDEESPVKKPIRPRLR